MTSFDAMLDTWRDAGLGLIALALVVAGADKLRARRASRQRLVAQPDLSPEALDAGLERLRAEVLIPAQRGGERRAR